MSDVEQNQTEAVQVTEDAVYIKAAELYQAEGSEAAVKYIREHLGDEAAEKAEKEIEEIQKTMSELGLTNKAAKQ